MSIFEYNGSAIVAMAGKDCVAIGSDLRFGVQLQTITTDSPKVYKIHDKLFLGLSGLATDAQTLYEKLVFRLAVPRYVDIPGLQHMWAHCDVVVRRHNLYKLREERVMKPETFGHLVSSVLYERRFGSYLAAPVIAGIDEKSVPYLCGMDSIGAMEVSKDFMVSGTAPESLYGMCESMWKEDMSPDELFETIGQCLLSGVDRDALAGWGAVVHIITKDKLITRTLRGRMD